jgi:hypothetical protein
MDGRGLARRRIIRLKFFGRARHFAADAHQEFATIPAAVSGNCGELLAMPFNGYA